MVVGAGADVRRRRLIVPVTVSDPPMEASLLTSTEERSVVPWTLK